MKEKYKNIFAHSLDSMLHMAIERTTDEAVRIVLKNALKSMDNWAKDSEKLATKFESIVCYNDNNICNGNCAACEMYGILDKLGSTYDPNKN